MTEHVTDEQAAILTDAQVANIRARLAARPWAPGARDVAALLADRAEREKDTAALRAEVERLAAKVHETQQGTEAWLKQAVRADGSHFALREAVLGPDVVPCHEFQPVEGHPDDDECTHRWDETDATYCGRPRSDHEHDWDQEALTRAEQARCAEADAAALRERVAAVARSIEGDEEPEHNEGCEGEPTCFACILADLRAALDAGGAS